MSVEVTTSPDVEDQLWEAHGWWFEHREKAPMLLMDEYDDAVERLAESPRSGRMTPREGYPDLRNLLLPKTRHHLVYVYEEAEQRVTIIGLWNAVRGQEPKLPPRESLRKP